MSPSGRRGRRRRSARPTGRRSLRPMAPRMTPATPMSSACHVSAAAALRAGRPRARAMARSWRLRRRVIVSWCSMPGGGEDTQEPGEIRRNCADLAQPVDASWREHLGKSVLEQGRSGGVTGSIVGHVGEHVGGQVAVVGRSSGADQRAQRRDRHDEPVGGVVVPPGHDRAGDTQGQAWPIHRRRRWTLRHRFRPRDPLPLPCRGRPRQVLRDDARQTLAGELHRGSSQRPRARPRRGVCLSPASCRR